MTFDDWVFANRYDDEWQRSVMAFCRFRPGWVFEYDNVDHQAMVEWFRKECKGGWLAAGNPSGYALLELEEDAINFRLRW